MRKLIELEQENLIECDHCDFFIPNDDPKNPGDSKEFLNASCPNCGENLLTERDYLISRTVEDKINWLNKWFSWLTIFLPKAKHVANMKDHDGVKIEIL